MALVELFIIYIDQYPRILSVPINTTICFVLSLPFVYLGYFLYPKLKDRFSDRTIVLSLPLLLWFLFYIVSGIIYLVTGSGDLSSAIIQLTLFSYVYSLPFLFIGYVLTKIIQWKYSVPIYVILTPVSYICWFIFWVFLILTLDIRI